MNSSRYRAISKQKKKTKRLLRREINYACNQIKEDPILGDEDQYSLFLWEANQLQKIK